MTDNELSFKISAGLKNIIGRDLITDDFVAVFELVKNSFDAHAKKVIITFKKDTIIIADDGKGMDLNDINNKWLFVAYSAKREGIEDKELEQEEYNSYRDKIHEKKFFAGAKGIGRFSCDRLGSKLILTSKKAALNAKIEQIEVDWNAFEQDPEKKFIDIKVKHRTNPSDINAFKKIKHGTILEISKLNSKWDREKKLNLKYSLEKLINPFEDNPLNGFSVFIEDEHEIEHDSPKRNKRTDVNGEIRNFVFETLKLKTTQILTEIDSKGEYITNTLWDRGTLIYKIRRENNTIPKLIDIKIHLFHLNRAAKNNFTRLMGIQPVRFGSIFLYKNGFRIPPYGDYGFDYFGVDSRKTQKHFDRFGSRDLIGRIEIIGDNPDFKEISSRDGGLVRNDHYYTLVNFFLNSTLQKLENYAKKVQFTSKADKDSEDLSALNNITAKSALLKLISNEINNPDTELIDLDRDNLSIRTKELIEDASKKDVESLKLIAEKLSDKTFLKEANETQIELEKLTELRSKLKEEEEAREKAEEDARKLEKELALEKEKNTYLRTSSRSLSEDAKGLVHNIKITSKAISRNVDNLYYKILHNKMKQPDILKGLGNIKFHAEKALKISKIITRSNFNTEKNEQVVDLVKYIEQYIGLYSEIYDDKELSFQIINNEASLIKKVSILDVSVILDDLISNSEKANANQVQIELTNMKDGNLRMIFSDNGDGVKEIFLGDPEKIFELGITTTDGSGIGLYSVRTALKLMKSTIRFLGNDLKLNGASFEIIFY